MGALFYGWLGGMCFSIAMEAALTERWMMAVVAILLSVWMGLAGWSAARRSGGT